MSALSRIVRREWTEFGRDRRLKMLGLVTLVLAVAALLFGALEQRKFSTDRAEAVTKDAEIWQSQGAVNPHSAAHFGMFAFRPRASLTAFDPGLAPWMGEAVWVEAHYQNPAQGRPAEGTPLLQRFGDLSAAWMLQTLLPLLIILAGYASVAGEREQGMLKLQLIQGVRSTRLLAAKTLTLCGLAALLLVPMMMLAGGAAWILSDNTEDTLLRWSLLLLAYLLYAAIWALVTVGISALARSARKALVILLVFWALAVVLLPRLAADTGARPHPVASAGAFWEGVQEAREKGIDGHNPGDARAKALQEAVMHRYGVSKIEDLPIDFAGISLQAGEDYGNLVFDRMYGELEAAQRGQQTVALGFSPLTPLAALKPLSAGLSGNDIAHQEAFTAAAEQHRRAVQRVLNDEQTAHGKGANFNNIVDTDFWKKVPTFNWQPPEIAARFGAYLAPALILLAWFVAGLALVAIAANRLEKSA